MITILFIVGVVLLATKVIPFIFRVAVFLLALFCELALAAVIISVIGIAGMVLLLCIDLGALVLIKKLIAIII